MHVYGNVLYLAKSVPKLEWLAAVHSKVVVKSAVHCGILCVKKYDLNMSCNSLIYDESDNTCSMALYHMIPAGGEQGLRVAWSSSVSDENVAWFAIDRQVGNDLAFFSTKDNEDEYPWLAIDLIRPENVKRVEIRNRITYERRTRDIEIRVGYEKPFARETKGDTLYTTNTVCGFYAGPAAKGSNSVVECSVPVPGRFITLQRIKTSSEPALNIVEVIVETEPLNEKPEAINVLERPSNNGQCPEEYPFAFQGGSRCCQGSFEDAPSEASSKDGFIDYDSDVCSNGDDIACVGVGGCMNYQYQRYPCKTEPLFIYGTGSGCGVHETFTEEECEESAKDNKEAIAYFWSSEKLCFCRTGRIRAKHSTSWGGVGGLIQCP